MYRAFLHGCCPFSNHATGEQLIYTFPGVSAANALHVTTQWRILTSMVQPLYGKEMCTTFESCSLADIPKCMVQAKHEQLLRELGCFWYWQHTLQGC